MALSTEENMRGMFLEATRQNLARSLHTSEDWDRFKEITRDASTRIEAEQVAHMRDHEARIAEATEIVLREEHGVRLDHPLPPWAAKQADSDRVRTKAETRVRQDYDRRIAAIKSDELDQYRDLTAEIRAREATPDQGKPEQSRSQTRTRTR